MRYLTAEWFEAADAAVRSAASTAPDAGLVVDQHIVDHDGRPLRYRIVIARSAPSVRRLPDDEPSPHRADATFSQSLETATSVARGETDAHQAFLLGRIRFEGDVEVLIERGEAFSWLEQTLGPLMARTIFESPTTLPTES